MLAPQLVDIYIEAMGYNPTIRANRINAWKADVMRPGFTAVIAENEFGIAGLAYGLSVRRTPGGTASCAAVSPR